MKEFIYSKIKNDHDWLSVYKQHNNGSIKGFKTFLKSCILFFISEFNIFLDKPYIDVSYLRYKDKLIDLDLLYDIFVNSIKESVIVNA
jgi:hypothetical protein